MTIPTADELRGSADVDHVKLALSDTALARVRLLGGRPESEIKASEKREYDRLAAEIGKLYDLLQEMDDTAQPKRKLKFGAEGQPRRDLAKRQVLAADDKLADWITAREGKTAVDLEGAWDALAQGLINDDWTPWHLEYAPKMKLAMTSTGEGGELIPAPLAGDVIDLMRANTPIFRAGARMVPMTAKTLDVARVTADPTATSWHAESGAIAVDSAMALDTITFTAKTLPVLVKASRELAEDASNLGEVVRRAISGAIGVELTRAALRGDGTSNAPTGIRNATGVTVTELGAGNGAAADYDTILDARQRIWADNDAPNAVMLNPRTLNALQKLKDGNSAYLAPPAGYTEMARFPTTVIPTNITVGTSNDTTEIYVGRWSALMVGMRTNLRIRVLDQRFADTGEIAFLAWLRADIQLEHGESFEVVSGVTN